MHYLSFKGACGCGAGVCGAGAGCGAGGCGSGAAGCGASGIIAIITKVSLYTLIADVYILCLFMY